MNAYTRSPASPANVTRASPRSSPAMLFTGWRRSAASVPIRSTRLRSPACCRFRGGLHEFERPSARNQARRRRFFEVQLQACQIFSIEIEMNVLGQVALESARRKVELDGSR